MAAAKPVFSDPPSLRFFGWWTTRTRGSAAAISSAMAPVRSVEASSMTSSS